MVLFSPFSTVGRPAVAVGVEGEEAESTTAKVPD